MPNGQVAKMGASFFSRAYFDTVYIPASLLVFGTWIVKQDLIPYAAALALALGGYRFYDLSRRPTHARTSGIVANWHLVPKKALSPNFQEFELQEKTVISHNVAM